MFRSVVQNYFTFFLKSEIQTEYCGIATVFENPEIVNDMNERGISMS